MQRWAREKERLLGELYAAAVPVKVIAERLGVSEPAVRTKASQLKIKHPNFWTKEEDAILRDSYPKMTTREVCQILGRSERGVVNRAHILGVHKPELWTQEEDQQLIQAYGNERNIGLAIQFGKSEKSIYWRAHTLGLNKTKEHMKNTRRTYRLNHSYFSSIDSEDKAYFLGLLWADGYVTNKKPGKYAIGITLQEDDKDILEKFRDCLGSDCPVIKKDRSKPHHKNLYCLSMMSQQMFDDLGKLGIVLRKTYANLTPPLIPYHLVKDFMRGLFDGDGCICGKKEKHYYHFKIAGSLITCEWVKNILKEHIGLCNGSLDTRKNGFGVWVVSGKHLVGSIYSWLYSGSTLYFSRKRNKFIELGYGDPV